MLPNTPLQADLLLAYARKQAAERQGRWTDHADRGGETMFGARLAESSSKDIIAERVFDRSTAGGSRPMAVRIARPEEDPKDATIWTCVVEFIGLPRRPKVRRSSHGVDQMQALLIAFELIEHEVEMLREEGHVVTWLGERDLGLSRLRPKIRDGRTADLTRARKSGAPRPTSRRGSPTRR